MYKIFSLLIFFTLISCNSNKNYDKYDYIKPNYQYNQQYQRQQNVPKYYYPPNSRYYNDPYILPQQNASPYYDIDQYYVPPTNYYNIETERSQQHSPANNKY
jgi:hypothetical protein